MEGKQACLVAAADKPKTDGSNQGMPIENRVDSVELLKLPPKLTKTEEESLLRRQKRQERFEEARKLHELGASKSEIARRLNINWRTVSKYIRIDECPVYTKQRCRSSNFASFIDYMEKRWEEGCHNATKIWHEIRKLGYDGARRTLARWATDKRKLALSSDAVAKKVIPLSARSAAWLLVKPKEKLTEDDKRALERMKEADEKVAQAYTLSQRFTGMVRERQPEALLPWLEDAGKSRISALVSFAKGIKQDLSAVTNALSLPWSNGQTEGQVNRLKLIKRQMYGRANFDLLRKRVIANPLKC
jgi:transposase